MTGAATFEASAGEIAGLLASRSIGARIIGDESVRISGVKPIDRATGADLAFIRDERYLRAWASSGAGVTLVSEKLIETEHAAPMREATDRAVIVVPDADLALVTLLGFVQSITPGDDPPEGVHPTAVIDTSATIGAGARIGAHVTIGAHANISANAILRAHAHVGTHARVGDASILKERATITERCAVGERCILHAGCVIGADGFGYRPPPADGSLGPWPVKIPHVGSVEIGDDVEIGASTCIDRATYGVTRVGDGTKIDNLCQIGHNCTIGRGVIICGCAAIAGSVTIGDGALLGGRVGIADNLTIGDGATIGALTGVTRDVPAGQTWAGTPAGNAHFHHRKQVAVQWLAHAIGPLKTMLRESGHAK